MPADARPLPERPRRSLRLAGACGRREDLGQRHQERIKIVDLAAGSAVNWQG
jgi:hypothetical protein